MTLPNFIIGGTGRAGTTSLFRYLSVHPEVCASQKKEIMFFNTYRENAKEHLDEYESYFSHCDPQRKIIMEATPHYILDGNAVAEIIANTLPRAKMMFIIRNPVERLYTVYRNEKNIDDGQLSSLSFDDFVDIAIDSIAKTDRSELEARLGRYLETGFYAQQLAHYFEHFNLDDVRVAFFDEFTKDTRKFVCEVADFLGIDKTFYESFNFTIENKTRSYRNPILHRAAYLANRFFEKALNKAPKARQQLRTVYLRVNEARNSQHRMSGYAYETLTSFYRPHNEELEKLLRNQYGGLTLPDWIS